LAIFFATDKQQTHRQKKLYALKSEGIKAKKKYIS